MAFATADDLADRLQVDFTPTEQARATELLESATALIKREARQDIDQATDTISLSPTFTNVLLLPQLPVTDVTSVTVDGSPLSMTVDYYPVRADGVIRLRGRMRRFVYDTTVTYTHGYATPPADLAAICVEMSARAWVNPRGVASEQIGTYSARYITGKPGLVMLDHEERLVQSYRPRP